MSQTRRKSGRIVAKPQASMVEEGGSSMSASKSERDISSNEQQSEKQYDSTSSERQQQIEQYDSTSSERQQQIVLLKEGVHNLQNASSTIKEVRNLGNKPMVTRTPDHV